MPQIPAPALTWPLCVPDPSSSSRCRPRPGFLTSRALTPCSGVYIRPHFRGREPVTGNDSPCPENAASPASPASGSLEQWERVWHPPRRAREAEDAQPRHDCLREPRTDGRERVFPSLSGKGRKFFNSVQLRQLEALSSGLIRRGPPRWGEGPPPLAICSSRTLLGRGDPGPLRRGWSWKPSKLSIPIARGNQIEIPHPTLASFYSQSEKNFFWWQDKCSLGGGGGWNPNYVHSGNIFLFNTWDVDSRVVLRNNTEKFYVLKHFPLKVTYYQTIVKYYTQNIDIFNIDTIHPSFTFFQVLVFFFFFFSSPF